MPFIQNGSFLFKYKDSDYHSMDDKSDGNRTYRKYIKFDREFRNDPNIHLSCTRLDANDAENVRYHLEVDGASVTAEGFNLVFSIYGDTRLFYVEVSWIAYDSTLSELEPS